METGDRIRLAISAKGLKQAALARIIGIKPQDLQRILDGRVTTSKHVPAIAEALEVTVAWLSTGAAPVPVWAAPQPADPSAELQRLRQRAEATAYAALGVSELVAEVQAMRQHLARIEVELAAMRSERGGTGADAEADAYLQQAMANLEPLPPTARPRIPSGPHG